MFVKAGFFSSIVTFIWGKLKYKKFGAVVLLCLLRNSGSCPVHAVHFLFERGKKLKWKSNVDLFQIPISDLMMVDCLLIVVFTRTAQGSLRPTLSKSASKCPGTSHLEDVCQGEPGEEGPWPACYLLVSFFVILVKIKIGTVDDMNNLIVLVRSILIERKLKGT